jgi:hypothetical protein
MKRLPHPLFPRRVAWSGPESLEVRIAPAGMALVVNSAADSGGGSLRAAIEAANANPGLDTISFSKVSKIKLVNPLPAITDDLTFSVAKSLTLDGGKQLQLLSIAGDGVDVTLERMKFINGKAAAGAALQINVPNGSVTVRNCSFTGNLAVAEVEAGLAAAAVVDGVPRGGAIVHQAGTLTIEASTFSGNRVLAPDDQGKGGAIYSNGTVNITGSTFKANTVIAFEANGGAIFNDTQGTLTLTRSKVTGNTATGIKGVPGQAGENGENAVDAGDDGGGGDEGGAGYDGGSAHGGGLMNLGTASLKDSSVLKNKALGGSGGVGGKGGAGGRGGPSEPPYTSYGYTVPGIPAGQKGVGGNGGLGGSGGTAEGGGIWNGTGMVTIEHTHVDNNTAFAGVGGKGGAPGVGSGKSATGPAGLPGEHGGGGGIWNQGTVKMFAQSTASRNLAQGRDALGGGIASIEKTLTEITDAAVSKNRALAGKGAAGSPGARGANGERGGPAEDGGEGEPGGDALPGDAGGDSLGGGIYNAGTLTLKTSTLSGNLAKAGAGGAGGNGGAGGAGGAGGRGYSYEGEATPPGKRGASGSGGMGGQGGDAGSAQGGAIHNTRVLFDAGGYVLPSAGEVTIESSKIEKNTTIGAVPGKLGKGGAAGGAGALKGAAGQPGALSESQGGGVFSSLGKLTISGTTRIASNRAGGSGGGVAVIENVATMISNATITKNFAKAKGGGLFALLDIGGDPVLSISTLITKNKAAAGPDIFGDVTVS